jgi:hypothetical protein
MWPHKLSDVHVDILVVGHTTSARARPRLRHAGRVQLSPARKSIRRMRGTATDTVSLGSSRQREGPIQTRKVRHVPRVMYADSTQAGWWQVRWIDSHHARGGGCPRTWPSEYSRVDWRVRPGLHPWAPLSRRRDQNYFKPESRSDRAKYGSIVVVHACTWTTVRRPMSAQGRCVLIHTSKSQAIVERYFSIGGSDVCIRCQLAQPRTWTSNTSPSTTVLCPRGDRLRGGTIERPLAEYGTLTSTSWRQRSLRVVR